MNSNKIIRRVRAASIVFQGFLLAAISLTLLSNGSTEESKDEKATASDSEKATPGELPVKLEFVARFAQNYNLTFSKKLDAERYQISREPSANYRSQIFVMKIGEKSEDGKIRLESFEEKEGVSSLGVRVDTSEVSVTWLETGGKVTLTRRVPETIPTYFAQLRSPVPVEGLNWEEYVKVGSKFTLPENPTVKLTLAEAEKEQVHIEFRDTDGKLRRSTVKKSE